MNKIKLIAASLCTSALIGGAPLLATSVLAEESSKVSKDYVVDNADLLTQTEENELSKKLQDISDELQFDVVVVTTNTFASLALGVKVNNFCPDAYSYPSTTDFHALSADIVYA